MADASPRRSHEPIFWALFGAGGVLAALLAPALVFITGLAVPLGVLDDSALSYERLVAAARNPFGAAALFLVISLLLWHSMHRINHSLHDLGLRTGLGSKVLCYGLALVGTGVAAALLLRLF